MVMERVLPEEMAYSLLEEALASGSRIAIDTETNKKDVRDGRGYAMGISVAYKSTRGLTAFYLPFRHPNTEGGAGNYNLQRFLPVLQRILSDRVTIYFNAKFDLVSLSTLGLDTTKADFLCVMICCHLINENFPMEKSLDTCSK